MASVVITSLSEHRADGSVWITGTVDGVAWNLRWSKPLDISPGGLAVATHVVRPVRLRRGIDQRANQPDQRMIPSPYAGSA
jgi:hypothetical protein